MVGKDLYDKYQSEVKKMSYAEKIFLWRTLAVDIRLDHEPTNWDELIKLWSDDLSYKKSLIDWLKDYWHVPKRRLKYNDKDK